MNVGVHLTVGALIVTLGGALTRFSTFGERIYERYSLTSAEDANVAKTPEASARFQSPFGLFQAKVDTDLSRLLQVRTGSGACFERSERDVQASYPAVEPYPLASRSRPVAQLERTPGVGSMVLRDDDINASIEQACRVPAIVDEQPEPTIDRAEAAIGLHAGRRDGAAAERIGRHYAMGDPNAHCEWHGDAGGQGEWHSCGEGDVGVVGEHRIEGRWGRRQASGLRFSRPFLVHAARRQIANGSGGGVGVGISADLDFRKRGQAAVGIPLPDNRPMHPAVPYEPPAAAVLVAGRGAHHRGMSVVDAHLKGEITIKPVLHLGARAGGVVVVHNPVSDHGPGGLPHRPVFSAPPLLAEPGEHHTRLAGSDLSIKRHALIAGRGRLSLGASVRLGDRANVGARIGERLPAAHRRRRDVVLVAARPHPVAPPVQHITATALLDGSAGHDSERARLADDGSSVDHRDNTHRIRGEGGDGDASFRVGGALQLPLENTRQIEGRTFGKVDLLSRVSRTKTRSCRTETEAQ